jgi:hypothetical protein
MFPSQPLMSAIHSDRERQLERSSREHRMLEARDIEPVATSRVGATPMAPVAPTTKAARPSDPACGVA